MPIFERNGKKVLFVHVPKTGGSSLEQSLGSLATRTFCASIESPSSRVCPQHFLYRDMKVLLGEDYWHSALAVVRDPYDRMESEYWYSTGMEQKSAAGPPDFSTWVIKRIDFASHDPCVFDNHFRPQFDFLDASMEIFRIEEGLNQPLQRICEQLEVGCIPQIGRANISKREPVDWSIDAIYRFNEYYAPDFKALKYAKRTSVMRFFVSQYRKVRI